VLQDGRLLQEQLLRRQVLQRMSGLLHKLRQRFVWEVTPV
jgi:hypothetical protein